MVTKKASRRTLPNQTKYITRDDKFLYAVIIASACFIGWNFGLVL